MSVFILSFIVSKDLLLLHSAKLKLIRALVRDHLLVLRLLFEGTLLPTPTTSNIFDISFNSIGLLRHLAEKSSPYLPLFFNAPYICRHFSVPLEIVDCPNSPLLNPTVSLSGYY